MLKAGITLPVPWLERPHIEGRDEWYMEAFCDLSTCRAIGMDVGPIPWTAIVQYVEQEQIEDGLAFKWVIRAMDGAYLGHVKDSREDTK